jgi:hypothetical protein
LAASVGQSCVKPSNTRLEQRHGDAVSEAQSLVASVS